MLSCDTVQARLAGADHPGTLPAEVRDHARACPDCAGYARTLARIGELIPRLSVPAPSPGAKQAVIDLALNGPIIVVRPPAAATPSGLVRLARATWAARESWQYAAGVAATLAVGVGLWQLGTRPGRAEGPGPRHQLLAQSVHSLSRLSTAETAEAKVAVWSDAVGELAAETERVHAAADPADLDALDRMFHKAVTDGLVKQARALPPNATVPEKKARLKDALARLDAVRRQAAAKSATAPVQAVRTWQHLEQAAADGCAELEKLTRPEA